MKHHRALVGLSALIPITLLAAGCSSADATSSAVTTSTQVTTQAPTTTPGPPPIPSDPAAYHDLSERDWELIAKNPGGHKGELIVVYGTVTQFDTATGTDMFRIDVGATPITDGIDSYTTHDTNTFVTGNEDDLAQVVNGDELKIHARVVGSFSYDTTIGGNTTVPALQAGIVEVTNPA